MVLSPEDAKAFIEKPFAFVERIGLQALIMEPRRVELGHGNLAQVAIAVGVSELRFIDAHLVMNRELSAVLDDVAVGGHRFLADDHAPALIERVGVLVVRVNRNHALRRLLKNLLGRLGTNPDRERGASTEHRQSK